MITELKDIWPARLVTGPDGGHFYSGMYGDEQVDAVPSVTTRLGILGKGLENWAAGIAASYVWDNWGEMNKTELIKKAQQEWLEVSSMHANVGTATHDLLWIDGISADHVPNPMVAQCIRAWHEMLDYVDIEVVQDEQAYLGKSKYGYYGGQIDAIVRLNKQPELVLLEFKTSRMLYPAHAIQTAAYAKMLGLERAIVVRLDKYTSRFETAKVRVDYAYDIFEHIMAVGEMMGPNVWTWDDRS